MSDKVFNVLFLCTGNSARSILAESILRKDGGDHFQVFSAGSMPKGEVNPLAIETLERVGYPTEGLRSKSWDEFATPDEAGRNLIAKAMTQFNWSARVYHRILRVARSIADLEGAAAVGVPHVAQAIQYRRGVLSEE